MSDNNEIRDGLSNITDQQTDSVLISNAQHKRTARLLSGLLSAVFLIAAAGFMYFYNIGSKLDIDKITTEDFIRQNSKYEIHYDPETDPNHHFSEINKDHPPSYEVWSGDDLVERWHWYSEDVPNSEQYKKWIIKCTANYIDGEMSGYKSQLMQDYPTHHTEPETKAKINSIVYDACDKRKEFTLWTTNENGLDHGMRYKVNASGKWTINHWKNGKRLDRSAEATKDQIKESLKNNPIIQKHMDYLTHISTLFTFLRPLLEIDENQFAFDDNVEKHIDEIKAQMHMGLTEDEQFFRQMIDALPDEQQEKWYNFRSNLIRNPEELKIFIQRESNRAEKKLIRESLSESKNTNP